MGPIRGAHHSWSAWSASFDRSVAKGQGGGQSVVGVVDRAVGCWERCIGVWCPCRVDVVGELHLSLVVGCHGGGMRGVWARQERLAEWT